MCPQERLTSPGKFSKGGEGKLTSTFDLSCYDREGKLFLCNFHHFRHHLRIRGLLLKAPVICQHVFPLGITVHFLILLPLSCTDLFPVRERIHDSDLDRPPALPPRAPLLLQPSPCLSPHVQWADLAAIQTQLQMQSQVCVHDVFLDLCHYYINVIASDTEI